MKCSKRKTAVRGYTRGDLGRAARNSCIILGLAAVALGTAGCATPMAFNRKTANVDTTSAAVGLMVIETCSELRGPICGHLKPYARFVHGTTQSGGKDFYMVGFDNLIVTNETLIHLVSIPLSSSTWALTSLDGMGLHYEQLGKPALLRGNLYLGNFSWRFDDQASSLPSCGVVYLGHIKLNHRLRTSSAETRAGPVIPLIDQKMSRYYEGTFDVELLDSQDADMRLFRQHYPALNGVPVEKVLLHKP